MKKIIIFTVLLVLELGFGLDSADFTKKTNELSDNSLTFAVWLQSPETVYNGKTIAQNYKDIGINTFLGLWNWPSEYQMYPGYAVAAMQALKDADLRVYAGNDMAAVNWIKSHPEYAETFTGYLLGDEPDMFKCNYPADPSAIWAMPDSWMALGNAIKAADPVRPIYANFGKGFALDPWVGYHVGPGPTQADDFAKYVAPLSVISSDYYGITDPWEPSSNHGIWTYGKAVKNTLKSGSTRPVWGVLEASAPWSDAASNNWMFQRMPPALVMPVVWNMVVNGAQGIVYFCHDFSPNSLGYYAALLEPGMPAAMKAANESVIAYGAVLKTPTIPGTTVTTSGGVEVVALTKKFNNDTYVFAMADGNSTYRNGLAVDAEITISGETGVEIVEVLNESRTIIMTNGKFSDHFDPYEVHIYKIISNSSIDPIISLPADLQLFQNYPNPFNPTTTISFNLSKEEFVSIRIYDIKGNQVEKINQKAYKAGLNYVKFSGKNLISGQYFYKIESKGIVLTKKMILLK